MPSVGIQSAHLWMNLTLTGDPAVIDVISAQWYELIPSKRRECNGRLWQWDSVLVHLNYQSLEIMSVFPWCFHPASDFEQCLTWLFFLLRWIWALESSIDLLSSSHLGRFKRFMEVMCFKRNLLKKGSARTIWIAHRISFLGVAFLCNYLGASAMFVKYFQAIW